MQREARGMGLIPKGRGKAPHLWKENLPPSYLELLVGDSPACTWPLFSCAGSAVPANGCSNK